MELIVVNHEEEMSKWAAYYILRQLKQKPDSILGLATGGTPLGMYRLLRQQDKQLYAKATTFNLDEYAGLPAGHPQSYRAYMKDELFSAIELPEAQSHLPDGMADPEIECAAYEEQIEASGGIDLQILGIGSNGHIGFNEPGTPFDSRTHKVELKEETRKANQRFFDKLDDVPTHALTMGIGTILKSRKIVLLASGQEKQEALRLLLSGIQTVDVPATSLLDHPDVTVIADCAALPETVLEQAAISFSMEHLNLMMT